MLVTDEFLGSVKSKASSDSEATFFLKKTLKFINKALMHAMIILYPLPIEM